jgi:hypothetical protein
VKKDNTLGMAALFFIVMRAFAFAIGVGGGFVGMFFFRPALTRKGMEEG